MGLGSIVGTGLFVSLGIATGVVGDGILFALPLAALLALCNGLSSAQLAAAHPVSGGTYEYGYRFLNPTLGFTAGWMFLVAKGASAATAALGLAGYGLLLFGVEARTVLLIALGGGGVVVFTLLLLGGIRQSNRANLLIVGATLGILALFLAVGLPDGVRGLFERREGLGMEISAGGWGPTFHATALLFVAYTGYGRIATLGEEVHDPARTIPRAIWITLAAVAFLYMAVAVVALGTIGPDAFARATAETAAPLREVAEGLAMPGLGILIGIAAVTAMLGVLLNLLLGLSRVALAMGRRGDLPVPFGSVHQESRTPRVAIIGVAAAILLLVLTGDVSTTWSFSAFTVLIYYGVTNLAALRLPPEARRYPRWVAVAGLVGCLFLAFQVEMGIWGVGVGLLVGGLVLRALLRRGRTGGPPEPPSPEHRNG